MTAQVVYITANDRDEAVRIGRALVGEQLVACANVLDGATSIYRWQGAVEEDSEAIVFCKTRSDQLDRVIERVKELHSYDCPCVVSWPVGKGSEAYLDWVEAEARGTG